MFELAERDGLRATLAMSRMTPETSTLAPWTAIS